MKKNFLLLLLLPLAFLLNSCQKTEVVVPNRTILTTLASGNWTPSNGGRHYSAAINMPEIDNYFNERGGVLVYISFGDDTFEAVPQVYDGIAYSYVTRPGQIVLEVEHSDGVSVITRPGEMDVKIVLIESR